MAKKEKIERGRNTESSLRERQVEEELELAKRHKAEWDALVRRQEAVNGPGGRTSAGIENTIHADYDPSKGHRRTKKVKW